MMTDHPVPCDSAWPDATRRLAAIVAHYTDMVYSTCRRVLGNEAEAADVAQETFFQFYRQADEITTSIGAWLHAVATRRAIDLVRQNASRRRREELYATEHVFGRVPDSWAEVEPLVDEALEALSDDQRELVVVHFLERRTLTELADDSGVSQPTMSRRMASALDALRAQLRARDVILGAGVLGVMLPHSTYAAPALVLEGLGKLALAHAATAAAAAGVTSVALGGGTQAAFAAPALALLAGVLWLVMPHAGPRPHAVETSAAPQTQPGPATEAALPSVAAPGAVPVPEAGRGTAGFSNSSPAAGTVAGGATAVSGPGGGTGNLARWTTSAEHRFARQFGGPGWRGWLAGSLGSTVTLLPGAVGTTAVTTSQRLYAAGSESRTPRLPPAWPAPPASLSQFSPRPASPPGLPGRRVFGWEAATALTWTNNPATPFALSVPFAPTAAVRNTARP